MGVSAEMLGNRLKQARKKKNYTQEYIAEIRMSFGATLDNTVIKRPDGSIERLKKNK